MLTLYKITHIDFGDGTIKEVPPEGVSHIYKESGTYDIKVKAEELGWISLTSLLPPEPELIKTLNIP